MRWVFEVDSPLYPGAEAVYEVSVAVHGEAVLLTGGGGDPVCFVDPSYPGAKPLFIADGGPRRAVLEDQRRAMELAMRNDRARPTGTPSPATYDSPPDPHSLPEDLWDIQRRLNESWSVVREHRGDGADALSTCAAVGVEGLSHEWSDERWVENLLMIGGNAAVMLWRRHANPSAARCALPVFLAEVDRRGWRLGGPSNMLEQHEVQAMTEVHEELGLG